MSIDRSQDRELSLIGVVDWAFFAYSGVAAIWLAYVLLRDGVVGGWQLPLLVVFWLFVTYLVLPRLHGILTSVYVPNYFIGRARTSDGLLGDPVNLGLLGDEAQIQEAFDVAGWTRADDLGLGSSWHLVRRIASRRSYAQAPVSPLYLFGRQQDFAYQREVAGSPSKRHHLRLWRCPPGWLLPGGFPVHWLGAATYDRRVGLSLFTLQVTHKIEEDIDVERDFVVGTLTEATPTVTVRTLERFASGYHTRNGGGDRILTDGDLPILDLSVVATSSTQHDAPTDSRDRRPAMIMLGSTLALIRGACYLTLALLLLTAPGLLVRLGSRDVVDLTTTATVGAVVAILVSLTVIDVFLALRVLSGHQWARLGLMSACALTSLVGFASTLGNRAPLGIGDLPAIGGSILVLLALSSPRSREWSSRRSRSDRVGS
ncbi:MULTISPECIES: LssY C-terminal domain-containing protein [unclassified Rhodococcus (in: high G+C Gram-positive bacteria)]|uniref:LssY C-terminal domain-containing protein n=1 Tax=unclassified Rhodococcus (in: high G+C Gram-positive bacteria) TaxID=192944 RepID=UPI000AC0E467|nr:MULTISPECIES: LssY C-terminal domain-containing protein [unclassified Rhodococcus (in: high G+C Gram-positive bacteria)]